MSQKKIQSWVIIGVMLLAIPVYFLFKSDNAQTKTAQGVYKIDMDTIQIEILSEENALESEEDIKRRYQSIIFTLDEESVSISIDWYFGQSPRPITSDFTRPKDESIVPFSMSVEVHGVVDLYHDLEGQIDKQAHTVTLIETYGRFDQISEMKNRHKVRVSASLVKTN